MKQKKDNDLSQFISLINQEKCCRCYREFIIYFARLNFRDSLFMFALVLGVDISK